MKDNLHSPNITFEVATTADHFEQILALQRKNHYSSISKEQQLDSGFVFAQHTKELLQLMATHLPQIIAVHEGKVIGYNLAMTSSMEKELPSLIPMFEEFKKWTYKGKPLIDYPFIVGGQVCVDEDFRGMGLIRNLYQATADKAGNGYQLCVTEISVRNVKSLKSHQKLGFEILGTYNDGVEIWNLVVWKFARSVSPVAS